MRNKGITDPPFSRASLRVISLGVALSLFSGLQLGVSQASASVGPTIQSDQAAIRAMQNVVTQSGGAAAWQGITSAKESFVVSKAGEITEHTQVLLDDWSSNVTRYRRGTVGQHNTPTAHDGESSFAVGSGVRPRTVPEFDQGRLLASRLPAAAIQLMLGRSEYILTTSTTRHCPSGNVCVDVRRVVDKILSPLEQQWTLGANGLPLSVMIAVPEVGLGQRSAWTQVQFVQFESQGGLLIPVQTQVQLGSVPQIWHLSSFSPNVPFDTAKFDQEVIQ